MKDFVKSKRAYYFTLDAFIALIIIFGVIFFIRPSSVQVTQDMRLQEDLLEFLSSLKIGEIDNAYVQTLIANGNITNLNQSVLEQIGEFYAKSDPKAQLLAEDILNELNLSENIGIYFNGIPIAVSGNVILDDSDDIWVSRQIISGIQQGDSSRGYSSRAFLFSNNKVDYFYFGGYVGDGNITAKLNGDIIEANIEGVFSGPFDLYINDVFADSYVPVSEIPYKINLADSLGLFNSGDNYIDFKSTSNLYIAGGYVRVVYNSSSSTQLDLMNYLPGIEGLINIYDSFYVPGTLSNLEIFLHYNSSYNLFLNIGDIEVYGGDSDGTELSVLLDNSTLSSVLDYSELSQKTIPFRLGLRNISYSSNNSGDVDVISVTDLSGSMEEGCSSTPFWCCLFSGNFCGSQSTCTDCGETWEDKIGLAKQANNAFIDFILNYSQNRVGLVGYANDAPASDYHALSNNNVSLKSKVTDWSASGSTCICCGINRAVQGLMDESDSSKFRSIVVMSDGQANVECSEQGTGSATQDAIQAACDAYDNQNIIVYAIGFGSDGDETTLQSIASCGGGNYYYGDIDELIQIYEQIADEIIIASYSEQTVIGEADAYTKLYPDSYISVSYDRTILYGMVITVETSEFGNDISQGNLSVPGDVAPYEVKVISYSGSKWTDNIEVYNNATGIWDNVFNLSRYNLPYINLGDPYVVNIPIEKIIYGDNSIRVSAGLSSLNSTGGSPYNKIIYSFIKNLSSYSPIVSSAEGCIWIIEFEDTTNTTISIPSDYSGSKVCYYTSSNLAYNNNDAIDNAIFNLLSDLDLNSNRMIETKFSENDLTINSVEVTGIPFTWETEVQARVWK